MVGQCYFFALLMVEASFKASQYARRRVPLVEYWSTVPPRESPKPQTLGMRAVSLAAEGAPIYPNANRYGFKGHGDFKSWECGPFLIPLWQPCEAQVSQLAVPEQYRRHGFGSWAF